MNRVDLSATAHDIKALRYTPAGLPVVDMLLDHMSEVLEAGQPRRVAFQLSARAMGDMAHFLADTPLGAGLRLQGFLAPTRQGSSRIVLHIQQAERLHGGTVAA